MHVPEIMAAAQPLGSSSHGFSMVTNWTDWKSWSTPNSISWRLSRCTSSQLTVTLLLRRSCQRLSSPVS